VSGRRRGLWGTRFGFYLAAIGSAFGLGNLWRFPYVAVENGGGAFVLLYVFFAVIIGLSLLVAELMLGKLSRRSVVSACYILAAEGQDGSGNFKSRTRRFVWIGRFSLITCLLILSYYAVISGWVLHFLAQFFFNHLMSGSFNADVSLRVLHNNGWLQIALASVHLLIAVIIVGKGVQEGMEKWVSNSMPVFVLLLIILVTRSLSLPTAPDALRFLFYPDFTKLTYFSMLQALGHVFFTLSVGFGTMVTFGSYLNEQTHIPSAGFRVTAMDTVISLFAGLLVFPLLMAGGMKGAGPELLFQALPRLLNDLDSGFFFGMAFFICLYLAALGASIGLLESIVANLLDFTKLNRTQASWLTGCVACVLAVLPALSTSVFGGVHYGNHGLLEIFDAILINGFLPLSVLGIALAIASRIRTEQVEKEFVNDASIATTKLYSHWLFIVRWLAPAMIIVAFALAGWGMVRDGAEMFFNK
jgi:neurotransmitter:Na+ symporter, NSS family